MDLAACFAWNPSEDMRLLKSNLSQGPFTAAEILKWLSAGFYDESLPVRHCACMDCCFSALNLQVKRDMTLQTKTSNSVSFGRLNSFLPMLRREADRYATNDGSGMQPSGNSMADVADGAGPAKLLHCRPAIPLGLIFSAKVDMLHLIGCKAMSDTLGKLG